MDRWRQGVEGFLIAGRTKTGDRWGDGVGLDHVVGPASIYSV